MDDKQLEFYKDIIRHPKKYSNYYILPISGNVNIVSYEVYNQYVYAITDSKVIITFPDEKTLEQYGSCSDCFTKISSREFP
jgi:hypothetical protein